MTPRRATEAVPAISTLNLECFMSGPPISVGVCQSPRWANGPNRCLRSPSARSSHPLTFYDNPTILISQLRRVRQTGHTSAPPGLSQGAKDRLGRRGPSGLCRVLGPVQCLQETTASKVGVTESLCLRVTGDWTTDLDDERGFLSQLSVDAPHTGAVIRFDPAGGSGVVGVTRPA